MSQESGHGKATLNIRCSSGEDGKQQDLQAQPSKSVENKELSCGQIAMLGRTEEFFQICDSEGKGFITSTDMRVKSVKKVFLCFYDFIYMAEIFLSFLEAA